jgi:hypothetical protein
MIGALSIAAGLGFSSCNLQVVITAQVGTFLCDTDSQCPDDMFCENYLNTYFYYADIRGQPIGEGKWGFCSTEEYLIRKDNSIYSEICNNGRDEDGDDLVDCLDPECQTAPPCRTQLQSECPDGESSETCDARLGFPLVRLGRELNDDTCPPSVGYPYVSPDGDAFCLPRCRLYFENSNGSPDTNRSDSDFLGSDNYCGSVTAPYATHAAFSELRCQHTGMSRNMTGHNIQDDVCLPLVPDLVVDTPTSGVITETCFFVCGASACLQIPFLQRNWTYFYNYDETRMIDGNDPEKYTQTAFYCLD